MKKKKSNKKEKTVKTIIENIFMKNENKEGGLHWYWQINNLQIQLSCEKLDAVSYVSME